MKVRESEKWLIAGAVGLLVVTVSILLSLFSSKTPSTHWAGVRTSCKTLSIACYQYAKDNEGKFPPSFDALYPDYIDVRDIFSVRDSRGNLIEFDYVVGAKASDPPDTVLIASPFRVDGKWIVGYVDGRVVETDEKPSLNPTVPP